MIDVLIETTQHGHVATDSKSPNLPATDPEKEPFNPEALGNALGPNDPGTAEPHREPGSQRRRTSAVWGWPRKTWRFVRFVRHVLTPARFSLFVALAGAAIFLLVQQGTEILRGLAEPNPDKGHLDFDRLVCFYAALLTWALYSWYWARVLLNFRFPGVRAPYPGFGRQTIEGIRLHGPRIFGVLPLLIVAAACFFMAPRGYNDSAAGHPKNILFLFGWLAVVLALLLYIFFILRRRWLNQPLSAYQRVTSLRHDPGTWHAVLAFGLLSVVLLVLFLFQPVTTGLLIGSGAIVCLTAAAWVCFGSLLVLLGGRLGLPLVGLLVAWAILSSLWNDNHSVRTIPAEAAQTTPSSSIETAASSKQHPAARPSVQEAFLAWHEAVQKAYPSITSGSSPAPRPVFIVATEGGGIRAAYWTALVLAAVQDRSNDQRKTWSVGHPGQPLPPDFASHLFAVSGVSGGSLGAVVFNALLAENVAYPIQNRAHDILRQDFLSPTLAAMFFPDLLQRFLPFPIAAADRGVALEKAWEYGWQRTISGKDVSGQPRPNRLAQPFRTLWKTRQGAIPLPALFLNGTRVESGKRVITSNLLIKSGADGEFADAEDAEAILDNGGSRDIPLSTAAHMSARFTYVSPAGRLPDGGHIVDGGYFENSAAGTALEILYAVEGVIENADWPERIVPVVIQIRNGPTKEKPDTPTDSSYTPDQPEHDFLSEVLAPVNTLLNTRNARASFSQEAIDGEQNSQANGGLQNSLRFGLHSSAVPLPLGWMLSGDAANEMRRQLRENSENQKALSTIMEELLGKSTTP
jgi:hypothetical protein